MTLRARGDGVYRIGELELRDGDEAIMVDGKVTVVVRAAEKLPPGFASNELAFADGRCYPSEDLQGLCEVACDVTGLGRSGTLEEAHAWRKRMLSILGSS